MKLVTAPIFYVNSKPHIGHLYTAIICDTYKRWFEFKGQPTMFSIGTDEHGLKVQQAALQNKMNTMEFCTFISGDFKRLFDAFNVGYTDFIRTTEGRHSEAVSHFWKLLMKNGYISKGHHEGWYSVSDEQFVPESQVYEKAINGETKRYSRETDKELEWTREENYIFKLGLFRQKIIDLLKENPKFIYPPKYHREVLRHLELNEMDNLSISRISNRVQWGIDVPDDPSHKIYVWLDALVNYLTVAGYPHQTEKANAWPCALHVIGKDIVKFHCIYWPAFLMAAGLPLPKRILTHGHWLVNNQKMSKSIGNGVDPFELKEKYGVDPIRYFLIRDGGIGIDPEFTTDTIVRRYKHDLAGQLGNVIMRCASRKINPTGQIPLEPSSKIPLTEIEKSMLDECTTIASRCDELIEDGHLPEYLAKVSDLVAELNKYWTVIEPWTFTRTNDVESREKLQTILYITFEVIRIVGLLLQPVAPEKANVVLDLMNVRKEERFFEHATLDASKYPRQMNPSKPLFPKLE